MMLPIASENKLSLHMFTILDIYGNIKSAIYAVTSVKFINLVVQIALSTFSDPLIVVKGRHKQL